MKSLAEWNTASPHGAPPDSVLGRIVAIIDAVRECESSVTISELAYRTGMPKSTVSRLAAELTDQRYLQRTDGGVALGLRLFELGARASYPRRLVAAAAPVVSELAKTTGERVGLWVHQGSDMIAILTAPGRLPMLPTRTGTRFPALTTASGKAFLAFCADQRVVERVSAALPRRAADEFRAELTHVRETVVAVDSGAAFSGIDAVASPVLSKDHTVLGAISVAGPAGSMRADDIGPLVRAAGTNLTRRLQVH